MDLEKQKRFLIRLAFFAAIAALVYVGLKYFLPMILPFLLAFAAGAMIYVVVEELIPESQAGTKPQVMALFTLVGFSVMMVLDISLG